MQDLCYQAKESLVPSLGFTTPAPSTITGRMLETLNPKPFKIIGI